MRRFPKPIFHCSGTDSTFEKVMRKWSSSFARVHHHYMKYFENEDERPNCGWFYNERANISFLAAAAWECGWVAIEEFSVERRNRPGSGYGRADLFVGTSIKHSSGEPAHLLIEAKQAWPSTPANVRGALTLRNKASKMQMALNEVRSSVKAHYRCGAVFVAPSLSTRNVDRMVSRYEEVAEAFWDACWSLPGCWAAFAYADLAEPEKWIRNEARRTFPGIGVVLKVA